jgi:hypothetical protein
MDVRERYTADSQVAELNENISIPGSHDRITFVLDTLTVYQNISARYVHSGKLLEQLEFSYEGKDSVRRLPNIVGLCQARYKNPETPNPVCESGNLFADCLAVKLLTTMALETVFADFIEGVFPSAGISRAVVQEPVFVGGVHEGNFIAEGGTFLEGCVPFSGPCEGDFTQPTLIRI